MIIGAWGDDDRGNNTGSAYTYVRVGGTWSLHQKLTAYDGEANDEFGTSVAIYGESAIVGVYYDDDDEGSDSGSACMYARTIN